MAVSWSGPGVTLAGTVTAQVVCAVWPGLTVGKADGVVAFAVQPAGSDSDALTLVSGWVPAAGRAVVTVIVEPGVATAGVVSLNGCCTTTGAVPVTPLTVTLMVAVPWPTAVSTPARLTLTTSGLLLA